MKRALYLLLAVCFILISAVTAGAFELDAVESVVAANGSETAELATVVPNDYVYYREDFESFELGAWTPSDESVFGDWKTKGGNLDGNATVFEVCQEENGNKYMKVTYPNGGWGGFGFRIDDPVTHLYSYIKFNYLTPEAEGSSLQFFVNSASDDRTHVDTVARNAEWTMEHMYFVTEVTDSTAFGMWFNGSLNNTIYLDDIVLWGVPETSTRPDANITFAASSEGCTTATLPAATTDKQLVNNWGAGASESWPRMWANLADYVPTNHEGYNFLGWSTTDGGLVIKDCEYSTYLRTGEETLYPVWEEIPQEPAETLPEGLVYREDFEDFELGAWIPSEESVFGDWKTKGGNLDGNATAFEVCQDESGNKYMKVTYPTGGWGGFGFRIDDAASHLYSHIKFNYYTPEAEGSTLQFFVNNASGGRTSVENLARNTEWTLKHMYFATEETDSTAFGMWFNGASNNTIYIDDIALWGFPETNTLYDSNITFAASSEGCTTATLPAATTGKYLWHNWNNDLVEGNAKYWFNLNDYVPSNHRGYNFLGWSRQDGGEVIRQAEYATYYAVGPETLYPVWEIAEPAVILENTVASAKNGAVFTETVNYLAESYEIISAGTTGITAGDISYDAETGALSITAKGYAGEVTLKFIGASEKTVTIKFIGGNIWKPGINVLTGNKDAFGFNGITTDDLSVIFTNTSGWALADVSGNSAVTTETAFAFLHLVEFAEAYDLERPVQTNLKICASSALNYQLLINDSGSTRQGLSYTEADYNNWKSYKVKFPSGNVTEDVVVNLLSIGNFANGAGAYYDDISIKPYYRVDYKGLDGSVIETLYVSPDEASYAVNTALTVSKIENGKVYVSTGWAVEGSVEAVSSVALSDADIVLSPAGFEEVAVISATVGSAKDGAVFTATVPSVFDSVELVSAGTTNITSEDITLADGTLLVTAKGYAGDVTVALKSGDESVNVTVSLYAGNKAVPGINMLTGNASAFGFEGLTLSDLAAFMTFNNEKWVVANDPLNEGNAFYVTARWQYADFYTDLGWDITGRPLSVSYDALHNAEHNTHILLNQGNAGLGLKPTEEQLGTWITVDKKISRDTVSEGIADVVNYISLGVFNDAAYGDYESGLYQYFDNVSITPYYMITYVAVDGTESVEYALPANGVYSVNAELLGENATGYTLIPGGTVYGFDKTITLANEDITVYAVNAPAAINVASIRVNAKDADGNSLANGIRFKAGVTTAQRFEGAEYGFIVTVENVLAHLGITANDLTFDLDERYYVKGVAFGIDANGEAIDNIYESIDDTVNFTGVCIGITSQNYGKLVYARSYLKYTIDGREVIFYGNVNSASLRGVATAFKNDEENFELLDQETKDMVNEIVGE